MFKKIRKTEIFTLPNLLSLLRLLLIPVYMGIYLQADSAADHFLAGSLLALSCLTDAADGRIARRYHMESGLGKVLDPLADKITQFALILCLSMKYPILFPVLVIFVGKELIQTALGILHLRHGKILAGALPVGKICTTVLFISLTALILFPEIPSAAVAAIALTDGFFLILALFGYLSAYFGKHKKIQDI